MLTCCVIYSAHYQVPRWKAGQCYLNSYIKYQYKKGLVSVGCTNMVVLFLCQNVTVGTFTQTGIQTDRCTDRQNKNLINIRLKAAYITALISAKLQCNFLTLNFSPKLTTQTTPHGYFWWDSVVERGGEGEKGQKREGCLYPPTPTPLLINSQLDRSASKTISIKFPWIRCL